MDERVIYTKWIINDFFSHKKTWNWYLDIVYRRQSDYGENTNIFARPLRFSIRPWIGYQFGRFYRINLCPIGYVESFGRLGKPEDVQTARLEKEIRSTIEILQDNYINRKGKEWINYTHRYRLESRWRDVMNPNASYTWNWRFRYRLRIRIPLNGKHFYENNVIYTVNYHEFHLENGPEYGRNHFSQNRNFVGFGYRFWDWVRIDFGYLHQYNWRNNVNDVDLSRGPMFYLFVDYLSKVKVPGKEKRLKQLIN
ncbi:MAG: DUF2490 domain-containing protein [Cytophagaceae bacterium]